MAARNDITGDSIKTKSSSQAYRDNWDAIFGKKEKEVKEDPHAVYNDDRLSTNMDKKMWEDIKEEK